MVINRLDKINELIRQQISKAIFYFYPDGFISVSSVDTSKDLSYCDITVLVLNDDVETVQLLNHNAKKLQFYIAPKISLRKMPKFRFHLDNSESAAEKIDNILKKI